MRFSVLLITALIFSFSCLSFLVSKNFFSAHTLAAGSLLELSDITANITVGASDVGHSISFTLPRNATQVNPSDYIIIGMDGFTNIRSNVYMQGSFVGSPTATVDGSNVKITGVHILPGNSVTIGGITADNPVYDFKLRVIVTITEDVDGNIIKNVGSVYCTKTSGQIAITATIAPPYASVIISGYSAPGTFITFTENGTVIGTDTTGVGGLFSKYMTGISPGTHTFSMYGVDSSNRTTSILDVTATTPIYQETTISDLLLSPTIEIDSSAITQGDLLVSNGTTIIDGNVSIFTEPHLRTYYATASALGNWNYTLEDTEEYLPGDYHIYSLVQDENGSQSSFSNALQFTVASESSSSGNPDCDISQGDLSCDGNINLIDFSIMMYYWGSANATADINEDDTVNLIDFSIMMYYWGT